MKKILTIVLTLAMIACMSVNVFATPIQNTTQEGSLEVTATSYGTYEYDIPSSLGFSKTSATAITVTVTDCDLAGYETLVFSLEQLDEEGEITVNNDYKEGVTAKIEFYSDSEMKNKLTQTNNSVSASNVAIDTTLKIYGKLSADAPAGDYRGVLYFSLHLED